MSDSVDRRVVEMRFDNKEFENNVTSTLTILDRLKEKLNLRNAGKNFETSGLSSAIEGVKERFSALEIVGVTALVNLTNSAINLGKHLARSLTTEQVRAGFAEYELKMTSVQTIMASTGEDIKTVNKYLNELNEYSDRTIYSFSDMTNNIGKFTNAGVKLEDAVDAIRGISNEAALSGANANEASRAMYNFSQALSSGYVKLIDWKSIENANMATMGFKDQLIMTAVAMGKLKKTEDGYVSTTTDMNGKVSQAFTSTKGFNDSLAHQWMTTEVLTQTLRNYSVDLENMSDKEIDAWRKQMRTIGYTKEQIEEIEELSKKAYAAAQDLKTFHQLVDTVKESIGSGWAQTFELIFGDLEEAKKLWTSVNNVISDFVSKSSDARNELLKGWHDYTFNIETLRQLQNELGENPFIKVGQTAREVFLGAIGDIFRGLGTILGAVGNGIKSIFPPVTVDTLVKISVRLNILAQNFMMLANNAAEAIKAFFEFNNSNFVDILTAGKDVVLLFKDAFKGLFDVITGGGGESALVSILNAFVAFVAAIARGVSAVIAFARASGIFTVVHKSLLLVNNVISSIVNGLLSIATGTKKAFSGLSKPLDDLSSSFNELFSGFSNGTIGFIDKLATALGKMFSLLGEGLSKLNLSKLGGLLAGGGILVAGTKIAKFIGFLTKEAEEAKSMPKLMDSVKEALGSLSDSLKSFQTTIKAGSILIIATSIGILAASCVVLAGIPIGKLIASVGAIRALIWELTLASKGMKASETKGIISISLAIVILAKAVKQLASVKTGQLIQSVAAIAVLMKILKGVANDLSGVEYTGMAKIGFSMILMATAIRLLAKPIAELGALDLETLAKGLGAISFALLLISNMVLSLSKIDATGLIKASASMILMATAIRLLVKPISELGSLSLEQLAIGLSAVCGALIEMAMMARIMSDINKESGSILKAGASLVLMAVGIKIVASALKQMSSIDNVENTLIILASSLLMLAGAMLVMKDAALGSVAMIGAAAALMIMAPAIALLSSLNVDGVVTGLLALAGTLIVFGGLAAILSPLTPVMIALGAAVALFGAGIAGIGAGVMMLVTSFSMLTTSVIDGASAIAQALPIIAGGIMESIIVIIEGLGNAASSLETAFAQILTAIINTIVNGIPDIVKAGLKLVLALLEGIGQNIGKIVEQAADIVVGFINGIAEKLPDIIDAGFNLIISFFNGMADAIAERGPELINAIIDVVLAALEMLAGYIPIFGKQAKEWISEMRKGLRDGKDDVKSEAKKVANAADSGLDIPSQVQNGANAVAGLIRGLNSMKGELTTTANIIGNIVDEVVRKKNEMHSPSRRLARTGRQMMEGLIQGVDSLTGEYEKKADDISTVLISSVGKSVNSVNDLMSGDWSSGFNLNGSINKAMDVNLSMDRYMNGNNARMSKLSDSLDEMTSRLQSMESTMADKDTNHTFNFSIPLDVNGRELARAQATYTQSELDRAQMLENRKLGII